ncbi:cytochrome P450 [Paecilomyces variotii No. 5]|uniref:Cytochrome P450 n=1 Tax=Byssochlamys spectabilis (strain No. 5 / NBRC 109023) TaxID=1356009 RepID=V5I684_BYSSN|nr:cytochrome P450 [Paecilomyces variotii No. 5]
MGSSLDRRFARFFVQQRKPTTIIPRTGNRILMAMHAAGVVYMIAVSWEACWWLLMSAQVVFEVAQSMMVLTTSVVVVLLWVVTESVRRLFFHPLSHIPGPRLAALTRWYEFYYDVVLPGKYIFKIQELHHEYGPILRITPDEIHINDVGFLDTVYSGLRDKYEYSLRALRVPGGVGTTADAKLHKLRREALVPFFSKRNILSLQHLVTEKVDQLFEVIAKHAGEESHVNLSDLFFAFSSDVVNNFLFAHKTNGLADEKQAGISRNNSKQLLLGVHVNKHLPWIPDFLEALPTCISRPLMPPGLIDMFNLFGRVHEEISGLMKAQSSGAHRKSERSPTEKEAVYESILVNESLPPQERTLTRLEQEGALLSLAGTESPAQSLSIIFYHLLAIPSILNTLRTELETVPVDASWSQLEKLPYLMAVIEEGNRLSFGVTARGGRRAYEELVFTPSSYATTPGTRKSYRIPAHTPLNISTLSAHTAQSVFPDPFTFNPERWLGEAGRERKRFQMAFSKGSRKCLGIELASAELCLVIAALVRSFEMTLYETDARDVSFEHDYQIAMPKMGSKGVRATVKFRVANSYPRSYLSSDLDKPEQTMEVAPAHNQDDGLYLNTDMQGLQVVESDHHAQNWNQTYAPETKYLAEGGYHTPSSQPPPLPRICGMKKSTFWVVVGLMLAVIVGAVVGGAVGGTVAHSNSTDITNSPSRETTDPSSNHITSSASHSASSTTGTATASITSSAVTSGITGIAENPCPGANRTTITASSGTLFSLFCGVDWPRGIEAADGNGTVSDLGRSTTYTLDDCIETCIQYNKGDLAVLDSVDTGTCRAVVYQANLTAVFDGGQGGNCFLKDRIGRYASTGFGGMAAGAIG